MAWFPLECQSVDGSVRDVYLPNMANASPTTDNITTITRAELTEQVYRAVDLSRQESQRFVETVLEEIIGALVQGDTVKLSGFGTFSVRNKRERIGRNPKTKEEAVISARRVVLFRPSLLLKKALNKLKK